MSDRFFLDTNVLIYANDLSSPHKQKKARELIQTAYRTRQGCLSTQVLQEFFVAVTRKARVGWENARAQLKALSQLDLIIVETDLILGAVDLHRLRQLSFWDALIVKSASAGGCSQLFTEDLNHGQVIDGVRVINPFRA